MPMPLGPGCAPHGPQDTLPADGERQVAEAHRRGPRLPTGPIAAKRPHAAVPMTGLRRSAGAFTQAILIITAAMAGLQAGDADPAAGAHPGAVSLLFEPAPELTAAMPPAGIIGHVAVDSLASRAGLRVGDRLLAIDGCRIHDASELRLYQELLPNQAAGETWTVVRDGALVTQEVTGLDASSHLGLTLYVPDDQPTWDQLLTRCGIAVNDDDRPLLKLMPGRVVHALQDWISHHGDTPAPAPWLQALTAVFLQAMRGAAKLPGDLAVPVPVLAKYDAFLRAVIEQRTVGFRQPDLAAYGIDRLMVALWYPYLSAPSVALGKPRLANDGLEKALARLIEDPDGSLQDRRAMAGASTSRGGEVADQFLGQVAAALLDDANHGGWPFRSRLIWDEAGRTPIIGELQRRVAANAPDADLAAYALIGPLTMNGDADGVLAAVAALRQDSPYLAWRGVQTAYAAAAMHRQDAVRKAVISAIEQAPLVPTPADLPFYNYCTERSNDLSWRCSELDFGAAHGRPKMFRDHPELVAAALAPDAGEVERRGSEELALCDSLNEVAWASSTDESVLDAKTAQAVAAEMQRLRGRHLRAHDKDTVAACFARSGAFDHAMAWEAAALTDGSSNQAGEFGARLELYRAGMPFVEKRAQLIPMHDIFPDGSDHLVGFTLAGKRAGHWQEHHPGGAVAVDGWMYKEQPFGRWQTFDKAGHPLSDGWVYQGHRVGPWRTFHANGALASAGSFSLNRGQEQRFGLWQWHWEDGTLKEEGSFLGGRRSGHWRAWSADGALLSEVDFVNGNPQGGVWKSSGNPEFLPPIQLPTILPASQGGNDF